MALADLKLAEVLELLAAREPAPGGGSAAALTGALAAALTEMAAAFALVSGGSGGDGASGGEGGGDEAQLAALRDRAAALRAALLSLAEEDTRAYAPVLDALALERTDPERDARLRGALAGAAEVPLEVANAAVEVGELAAAVARACNAHVLGDAMTAAVLAEASTRAAARLVELNLARSPDDERLGRADALVHRAWAARVSVVG